ncbi:MAG TPA: glycerate kinase [Nocardioidaceae bacterium]|nr:glycerate kinase [Nocardioidaceae bacterium]
MRVVIAPDKFAGTLTAVEAAEAIAEGWRRRAPEDELELVPMADGGPGFVDVLHASLGGELLALTVTGPYGDPVPAGVLVVGDTGYVESAQACGLHLTPVESRDPERATTRGVGELVAAAVDAGARRVVVGLGGSGTNDGGAGLLAALGATATPEGALERGPQGLKDLESVDLAAARERVRDVTLVAATDVDNPLLGLIGATNVFGPQKGVAAERLLVVDAWVERLAATTDKKVSLAKGAGAAGGLGFALMLLGATREPGIELIAEAVGLEQRVAASDLVITGEGAFDFQSGSGKVPYGVAAVANRVLVPCIALAGKVLVGSRETRALGIESAYSVSDLVGEEASFADAAGSLAALAERTARTWSH